MIVTQIVPGAQMLESSPTPHASASPGPVSGPKRARTYGTPRSHPTYAIEFCPRCGYPEADGGFCPDCGWTHCHGKNGEVM